jgi:glycolate oxidase FAD binding subunit
VPKLMVGALGTLGVLVELTLRLHPKPEREATWLAAFPGGETARACVARVLDSALQPSRVEFLGGAAPAACGVDPAPAALAISIGSVAAGVEAQGEALAGLIRRESGRARRAGEEFWVAYDRALVGHEVVLSLGVLPDALDRAVAAVTRAADREGAAVPAIAGSAVAGVLRVGFPRVEVGRLVRLVASLRETLGVNGGGVLLERAPREARAALDPWGPVDPEQLDLMRRLRDEFDPGRVLNPGRFVGGL